MTVIYLHFQDVPSAFHSLHGSVWTEFSSESGTESTDDAIYGFRTTARTLKLIQQDRKCVHMSGNVTHQRLISQITNTHTHPTLSDLSNMSHHQVNTLRFVERIARDIDFLLLQHFLDDTYASSDIKPTTVEFIYNLWSAHLKWKWSKWPCLMIWQHPIVKLVRLLIHYKCYSSAPICFHN